MSSTITAPAPWIHEQAGQTETVEALVRRAAVTFDRDGIKVSPSKLSRIIRAHIRESGSLKVAAANLETYCLSYADPTGETALRNVMRGIR